MKIQINTNFTQQWFIQVLQIGIFILLAFLPLPGYALQVDITADDGVAPEVVRDVKTGAGMVERFYRDLYGLDIDYPIKFCLVSDKEAYISTIVKELNVRREEVEAYYYNTGGVTRSHTIISNMGLYTSSKQRLINVAHELTHQYQFLLGGQMVEKLLWLSEGSADVLAVSALSLHGYGSVNALDKSCMATLQAVPHVSDLAQLRGAESWFASAKTTGLVVNYRTSDEAVMYLIGKVGFEPVFTYYRLVGQTQDVHQAFAQAFGMSLEDFEKEFRGYLAERGIAN